MSMRSYIVAITVLTFLTMAGCDGDGGPSASGKASDYTGTWKGTYTLSGDLSATGVVFEFYNVNGYDTNGLVAGSVESKYVTGAYAGMMDATGAAVGEIDNEVDGTVWTAVVARTDSGISIDLTREGQSVAGEGVAGAPANGLNYKSTITNKTDQTVYGLRVILLTAFFKQKALDYPEIAPGESYTIESGALCPLGFNKYGMADGKLTIPDTSCQGDIKPSKDWGVCCCRSSSWEIRPVPGTQNGTTFPYTLVRL